MKTLKPGYLFLALSMLLITPALSQNGPYGSYIRRIKALPTGPSLYGNYTFTLTPSNSGSD
jgi:hypothetical protein